MIQTLIWLLPSSRAKNRLLGLFGHDIADSARIGPSLVLRVQRFEIGSHVRIQPGNVFLDLRCVRMRPYSIIAAWNVISADAACRGVDEHAGSLFFGTRAKLGSRCQVDATGSVVFRAYASIGGNDCLIESSEWCAVSGRRRIAKTTVGHHALVGSRAALLAGAELPDQSLLAANSTMSRPECPNDPHLPGLYAGTPARFKRLVRGRWFVRTTYTMTEHRVTEPLDLRVDDLAFDDVEVVTEFGPREDGPLRTPAVYQPPRPGPT